MNPFPKSKGIVGCAKRLESVAQNQKKTGLEYLGNYIEEPHSTCNIEFEAAIIIESLQGFGGSRRIS